MLSAPYHPSTNGLAERFVKTLKQGDRATRFGALHDKLADFLLAYRNAPHATTGESPAKLFLGRPLKTRLELVRPNLHNHVQQKQQNMVASKQGRVKDFQIGDSILARNYRGQEKWK